MADFDRYVRQFEEAEQQAAQGRAEAEKARDYFDGNQFTDEEVKILKRRKQPITPENLIKPKIEALCGLERQGRVDPIAYPRTPSKEDGANAATDALRYVEQDQDLDIKKSKVFENMLVEGFGGIEVGVRQLSNGFVDPHVVRIANDRLYADPYSSEPDYSDAGYMGYITWMDFDRAVQKWPDAKEVLEATQNKGTSSNFDGFDDKPRYATWYDSKRKRIRINTHYHLNEGIWHRCVFTLSGELEASKPSPFIDDEGKPENPLILQSAYVDRENDRYGIVRDMIPMQDAVNKRGSKFLHMVNSNRWLIDPSVAQDKEMIRKELAKPDAVVVGDPGSVMSLDQASKDSFQYQIYADARQSLKANIGPNAYMQGKEGNGQSGRAILAQQQAGMTEMTPLLDNLRHFTLRMYRQIWNRIRQYWNAERWIRVTDDEKNVKFVGLNTPPEIDMGTAQQAVMQIQALIQSGQIDPQTAEQYVGEIERKMQPGNPVAELDVDIEIDEVNETPTLQAEQFQQLTELASSGMLGNPAPPQVIRLIIQASNLRDKQKLIEMLDEAEEAAKQPNPMQDIQMEGAQQEVRKTAADATLKEAQAEKIGVETQNAAVAPHLQAMQIGARAGTPAAGVNGLSG